MTARVIRIPELPERNAEVSAEPETRADAGWDPYEVWRTRVLMPRLEETEAAAEPRARESKLSVLGRLRRTKRS